MIGTLVYVEEKLATEVGEDVQASFKSEVKSKVDPCQRESCSTSSGTATEVAYRYGANASPSDEAELWAGWALSHRARSA